MFNLGMGEITVILLLAMIFIGPKKLPELASGLGKLIREIRKTTADVKNEIQLDDSIRKPFEELRDAVTLPPEELKRRDRIRREIQELEKQAAEQAAREAAELPPGASPPESLELPAEGMSSTLPPDVAEHAMAGAEPVDNSAAAIALAAVPTEASLPVLSGAPPVGTVARGNSAAAAPPPPPSGMRKSSAGLPSPGSGAAGSELARTLRAEGRSAAPVSLPLPETTPAQPPLGSADRSNTTQILSDADLATLATTPPPPPPTPGRQIGRDLGVAGGPAAATAPPPPLPGATPPKTSNKTSNS